MHQFDSNTILGGIAIFFRRVADGYQFLVVKNKLSGNTTFISGAQEVEDASEQAAIIREIYEELELVVNAADIRPIPIRHEFIFGPKKKGRAGKPGSYQVFLLDATAFVAQIHDTIEVEVRWCTKDEVLSTLSFPDLKEVFLNASERI